MGPRISPGSEAPRRAWLLAAILAAAALAGGCSLRYEYGGAPFPVESFGRLKAGMSKAEVLGLLGPPDTLGLNLKGSVFVYRFHNEGDTGLEVSLYYASARVESSDRRTDRLLVFFDKSGRVADFAVGADGRQPSPQSR